MTLSLLDCIAINKPRDNNCPSIFVVLRFYRFSLRWSELFKVHDTDPLLVYNVMLYLNMIMYCCKNQESLNEMCNLHCSKL